ncbi:MAG: class I SAM-dependent methyltransferase [Parcubacteria group bacterium]|nr:class I SAM-dependent methyltransferase [Parcubacteria group bacterium]
MKHIARKSKRLRELWRKARFLKELAWHDVKNPRKTFLFFKVLPYTMVSYKCLANAYALAQKTEEERLQGAFVECGVWKGGAAAAMASAANPGRQIWLFDSFEGLPEPTLYDGARAKEYAGNKTSGTLASIGKCVGLLRDVQQLFFRALRLSGDIVHIEQGWFQDTLPAAKKQVGPIALLRMDADWYESTRCILENLFDSVVQGGYVIIDDYYCWEGCRRAVDEFVQTRKLKISIVPIDRDGVYFKKP